MSKPFLLLLLCLFATIARAQTEAETIQKAKKLVEDKKYESAYTLLDAFDPDNGRAEVLLLKEDIVLNYFVTSIMHQMFSLKDIGKDENILDYRGTEEAANIHMLDIPKALDSLIRLNPADCRLYKGLGNFYFEARLKYGENWLLEDDELKRRIEENYQKTITAGCADNQAYYAIGLLRLMEEKNTEAIPLLNQSIRLDSTYATAYYNLAYAYMMLNDLPKAIPYARQAMNRYDDPVYKGDAARMLGQLYFELDDINNARENFEKADAIDPGNFYTMRSLINLYLKTDDARAAKIAADFFNIDPTSLNTFSELEELYFNYKQESKLATLYEQQLGNFAGNDQVQGNISFFLGKTYIESDKPRARQHFENAREYFKKVFEKDHQVFSVIEEAIQLTNN